MLDGGRPCWTEGSPLGWSEAVLDRGEAVLDGGEAILEGEASTEADCRQLSEALVGEQRAVCPA